MERLLRENLGYITGVGEEPPWICEKLLFQVKKKLRLIAFNRYHHHRNGKSMFSLIVDNSHMCRHHNSNENINLKSLPNKNNSQQVGIPFLLLLLLLHLHYRKKSQYPPPLHHYHLLVKPYNECPKRSES
jgi:hypothetical protein